MRNISNVSLDQLVQELMEKYKSLTIMVPIVFLSFLLAVSAYRQQVFKSERLKESIKMETDKSSTLDRIVLLNERFKKLKQKGWSSLDSNQMMGVISDKAIEFHVKLADVTPQEKINKKNYVILPFSVNCEAAYKDLVRFLKALESFNMLFRTQDFNVSVLEGAFSETGSGLENKSARLSVTMTLCSVYFK